MKNVAVVSLALVALLVSVGAAPGAEWTPEAWVDEETIEVRTAAPGEDPYWFPIWQVVLDGEVYIRLGSRAAERFDENVDGSVIGLRIGGAEFDRVMTVDAADVADRVDEAMSDKYWSEIFIGFFPHPATLRLVPEGAGAP